MFEFYADRVLRGLLLLTRAGDTLKNLLWGGFVMVLSLPLFMLGLLCSPLQEDYEEI